MIRDPKPASREGQAFKWGENGAFVVTGAPLLDVLDAWEHPVLFVTQLGVTEGRAWNTV